ncbi:MAG: glycosyltransferase [Myxococcota bacterium]|nr:glycosyltransferase [Myxococcota bacterium]
MKKVVPILVLAFNRHDMTRRCIQSIKTHTEYPHAILLIDNGSEPGFSKKDADHLIRLEENLYYTKGINAGIRFALTHYPDADHICLLNNDVQVQAHWLAGLVNACSPPIGVVGNKQLLKGNPQEIIHAGTVDLLQGVHKGGIDTGQYEKQSQEVWVTFACVLLSRRCLEYTGLLDERMKHFYSDNDFCLRAQMAGFDVVYTPDSTVIHQHHASYKDANVDFTPDQEIYLRKWLGEDLKNKIFYRIFFDVDQKSIIDFQSKIVTTKT